MTELLYGMPELLREVTELFSVMPELLSKPPELSFSVENLWSNAKRSLTIFKITEWKSTIYNKKTNPKISDSFIFTVN